MSLPFTEGKGAPAACSLMEDKGTASGARSSARCCAQRLMEADFSSFLLGVDGVSGGLLLVRSTCGHYEHASAQRNAFWCWRAGRHLRECSLMARQCAVGMRWSTQAMDMQHMACKSMPHDTSMLNSPAGCTRLRIGVLMCDQGKSHLSTAILLCCR